MSYYDHYMHPPHQQHRRGGSYGPKDPEHETYRKLFIGGLSYDTTEETLHKYFEQWGKVVDCVIMKDPSTKRSRGFGFVTYKEAGMVDKAQANRPHRIDGREVESKRAMPREESGNPDAQVSVKKMFIGGLSLEATEEQVRDVFDSYGKVEGVTFITDKATGKRKGFAFVEFDDYDPVDKAVLKKFHMVNGKEVEAKKAQNKDQQMGWGGGRGGRGGGRGGRGGGGGGHGGYAYGNGGYGDGYNDGYGSGYGYQQGYVGASWGPGSGYNGYGGPGYGSQGSWGGGGHYGSGYGGDGYSGGGQRKGYNSGGGYGRGGYAATKY